MMLAVALWAIGSWGFIILPLYFESPRSLAVCHGGCSDAPVSWFYPILLLWTVLLGGVGAFGVAGFISQLHPATPTRVTVYADGFEIEYSPKRRVEARWSNNRDLPVLWDASDEIAFHPKAAGGWSTRYLVDSPSYSFRVPEEAFRAILSSGRAWGLSVETRRGGYKHFPEEVGYEFGPAARASWGNTEGPLSSEVSR